MDRRRQPTTVDGRAACEPLRVSEAHDRADNGEAGFLFDLSITGCQLLSPGGVKPNQVVEGAVASDDTNISCTGKVMWHGSNRRQPGAPLVTGRGCSSPRPDQRQSKRSSRFTPTAAEPKTTRHLTTSSPANQSRQDQIDPTR